jgi:hypothetical protein
LNFDDDVTIIEIIRFYEYPNSETPLINITLMVGNPLALHPIFVVTEKASFMTQKKRVKSKRGVERV